MIHAQSERLARMLYETYCQAVGGVDDKGFALPCWEVFRVDPKTKALSDAWVSVACVAQNLMGR